MTAHDPRAEYDFELDAFQIDACEALNSSHSVLVAAPTSSGKTVVAEHAVRMALRGERRCFYTTPIKALSNQKFRDLRKLHGADAVGLLTGDNSINSRAPIIVMTTEVLRNMIYARSRDLQEVSHVVLDEVHYLEDPARGPVWEEIIIHLPRTIAMVALSATVSNAEELGAWIRSLRGATDVIVETRRPVELKHHYLVGERGGKHPRLLPVFRGKKPNREGTNYDVAGARRRGQGRRERRPWVTPRRTEVIETLRHKDLLPAIYFLFSRAACDDAATACAAAGFSFTTEDERRLIRDLASERVAHLSPADLEVLDITSWLDTLEQGIAAHHAGMIPTCKEIVETLFLEGPPRRLRNRDPGAGHQHARTHGGDREADQVHRREPRDADRRAVHPNSPAEPVGAASTPSATRSCCGHRSRRFCRSRNLPGARTMRSARLFAPRTTWLQT